MEDCNPGETFSSPGRPGLLRLMAAALATALIAGCTSVLPPSDQPGIPPGALGISATPKDGRSEKDITYISPAKIDIENLYPGATGEFELEVHNGKNEATTFSITARPADSPDPPFEPLPTDCLSWIRIAEPNPVVGPKDSKFITITVTMPPDATVKGKKYEFLILARDTGQTGFIQIELGLRVTVSTQ